MLDALPHLLWVMVAVEVVLKFPLVGRFCLPGCSNGVKDSVPRPEGYDLSPFVIQGFAACPDLRLMFGLLFYLALDVDVCWCFDPACFDHACQ